MAQPKIRAYIKENFIPVKVDFDHEKEIVRQYNVRGIPDIWFLDSRGEKLRRISGFVPEDIFLSVLEYMRTDVFKTMTLKEYVNKR